MTASRRIPAASLVTIVVCGALACGPQRPTDGTAGHRAPGASTALQNSTATGAMTSQHVRGAGARLADGRVVVTGGWSPASTAMDVFDPVSGTWAAGPPSPGGRDDHFALALGDGRVALAGGTASSVDVFDPASGTWAHLADAYRQYSAAALLEDGRVLVVGGYDGVISDLASVAIFDPVLGTLQPTGSLQTSRDAHRVVALADGRALVLGGRHASTDLASTELYDPQTGTFSPGAPMSTPRMTPAVVRLADGRVLVAGGWHGAELASAEIYDPAANTWTPTGSMLHARQLHQAVLLPDGRVAVVGGVVAGAISTADVEVFDPATGTFALGASLMQARYYETSVLLATGQLLAAGGEGSGTYLTSAEIVDLGPCTPTTCAAAGKTCGAIPDGCGGTLACGSCAAGETCTANVCGVCAPATCGSLGASCGAASDGCGGTLQCGTCGAGQACVSGACVCTPTTCAAQGKTCGTLPDGCGGTLSCGSCGAGTACSASNVCVALPGNATFDAAFGAPRCAAPGASSCGSGSLLVGRAALGPELHAPNTIDGCADRTAGTFHSDESLDALRVSTLDGAPFAAGSAVRLEADVWAYTGYSSDALDLYVAADATKPAWKLVTTIVPSKAGAQTLSTTTTLPRGGTVQAVRGVFRFGGSALPCSTGSYDDHDDLLFPVVQPPDTTPPTVTLTAPAATYLAGTITLQATASDDVGVVRVAFLDGTMEVASAVAPPWQASWNTTGVANGARTLSAVAYDAAGNSASASRQVVVDNAKPTAQLVSPAAGATVSGTVTIAADATDNEAVVKVAFYDGTVLVGTRTASPWSVSWSAASAASGSHALTAQAFDAAGNVGVSPAVTVTVAGGSAGTGVATFDSVRRVPLCASVGVSCDSGTLLNGRAGLGPEVNAPNTLGGSCGDGTSGTYHVDESLDRLKISTLDGGPLAAGKTVRVDATVWVWGASSDWLDLYYAASADSPTWTFIKTIAPTASGLQTLSTTYVLPSGAVQAIRGVFRYGGSAASCAAGSYNDVDDLAFAVQ
ncbi:Ig-like domain-containing protein [Anaeromyxobacter diazotrophicus]|uniref:Uncharacterized protein n=1 Tax=Anaeromyxobacter diazotrophicus TaxID=2590199 RepID=A0A7I9VQT2_9BACT|nr:Ig-like domain-containing protein [Anaeromyxobacter diazotrophicus]GEJ58776.1 hypothetical protein AMYX_35170 [Anaeromyxobacter diazotrophicus]